MKISVDSLEILNLTPQQIKCIENDIPSTKCKEDLCDRIKWVLIHKYEKCYERLQKEWIPKLKERGIYSIPLDESDFCDLVFSQPDYKNREEREIYDI